MSLSICLSIGKSIYWLLIRMTQELQAPKAPPITSTIHKSPQHPLSLFQPTVFTSRSLATASNIGDTSASIVQVLSSQIPVQNCLTTQVKVKVILRLTVSQSVCFGVVPHLGHMTRNLFIGFNFKKVAVLSMWAPSLTRGRVCRL
jgi:hypothetical protein